MARRTVTFLTAVVLLTAATSVFVTVHRFDLENSYAGAASSFGVLSVASILMVLLTQRSRPISGDTKSSSDSETVQISESEVIIKVSTLEKVYDTGAVRVAALRGLDMTVQKGEMVAIMGPSGCGKTTLLNCLSGIDDPTRGSVVIDNVDLSTLDDNTKTSYRAQRMGFIFQLYNLLPVLSAVENVELPLLVSGTSSAEARQRARVALERVGLEDWAQHRPAELSGGQRQRVTIARALVNEPSIVWADEPTGDLDSATAEQVMGLIRELNEMHRQTFVIVSHDRGVAEQCHRIIHMRDGVIENEELTELGTATSPAITNKT